MAILGIGVDVCEIARIEEMLLRTPGLVDRLFSEDEARHRPASLAGRFAAKEAFAKALGSPGGLVWRDCEVRKTADGAPYFVTRGTVADLEARLGVTRTHLSMSHDGGIATAFVVCEDGH
ncbi:holo-[acyl-carrier protein] synthase [Raineyella antarctica]|uniref:Holo-[acyl-carrier-protein] synthase n=1 Tax=Raineyella antarctica TaxID=1577474 RepID=A0A1G6I2S5_9ACTN|nr:holo-ACP synthase [Raineyella antarctica]SDC00036.1 holo-[acyl-carrier protein] synthase [Raineyella antarctica]